MIVVWRVNTHCNLNCGFCAYARELAFPRASVEPDAILAFARTLSAYARSCGERVLVSWLGGEPFLWPPLMEVSERLVTHFGLEVSATTNGTALRSGSLRARILQFFSELTVSVDGPAMFHDSIRGSLDGFAQIRAHVRALGSEREAGRDLLIRVNTVLMRDNIELFPQLCEELCSWGVDEISFNALGGNDRPEFYHEHRLDPGHVSWLEEKLPKLHKTLSARGVRLLGTPAYLRRLHASASGERLAIEDCPSGEPFLFITERGVVSPCSFTSLDYGVPLSELNSLEELMMLSGRFRKMRQVKRSAWCGNCLSTQVFGKFAGRTV
jgi:MoaA/NifB/PqqE/SkfB family radical SAM enzyme